MITLCKKVYLTKNEEPINKNEVEKNEESCHKKEHKKN
jgi:hypothetical protein